jgi:TRAP-type uncharacterized transport system fused permease subunit
VRPRRYRPTVIGIVHGLRDGALAGAQLGVILAAIGVIVQMLVTTGLGTLFADLMIRVSGNSVVLALLLGMAISLLIGMGLPTPAAYSLAAVVVIPSLIDVGVDPLAAHFYGFYFAVFSSFTPPVAVGVLMASRIAGGSFRDTCLETFKLGGVCMLLPFFFVAFPNSLRFPDYTADTLVATVLLCVSTLMLAASIYGGFLGKLTGRERLFMLSGPLASLVYYSQRDAWMAWLPIALLAGFFLFRLKRRAVARAGVA